MKAISFTKEEKDFNTILDVAGVEQWEDMQHPGTELYEKLNYVYSKLIGREVDILSEYKAFIFAGIMLNIPEIVVVDTSDDKQLNFHIYRDHFLIIEDNTNKKSYIYSLVSFLLKDAEEIEPKLVEDSNNVLYPENLGHLVDALINIQLKYGHTVTEHFVHELLDRVEDKMRWNRILTAFQLVPEK